MKIKVKEPLTIRSSRVRLWGCGAHLALLAKGAGVQLPGHVASMTKQLLVNQSSTRKRCTFLPERYLFVYLLWCAFELLGWQELGPSNGSSPRRRDSNLQSSDQQALGSVV